MCSEYKQVACFQKKGHCAFRADVGGLQSCHICRKHHFTTLSFSVAQATTFAVSLLVPANAITAVINDLMCHATDCKCMCKPDDEMTFSLTQECWNEIFCKNILLQLKTFLFFLCSFRFKQTLSSWQLGWLSLQMSHKPKSH